jgi:hypothetical protein
MIEIAIFRQLRSLAHSLQTFVECFQPANNEPLNQMEDEKDGEYVGCKSTIHYESTEELGWATHDVQTYGLKTKKEYDAEKIEAGRSQAPKVFSAIAERIHTVPSRSSVLVCSGIFNCAKPQHGHDRGICGI